MKDNEGIGYITFLRIFLLLFWFGLILVCGFCHFWKGFEGSWFVCGCFCFMCLIVSIFFYELPEKEKARLKKKEHWISQSIYSSLRHE